MPCAQRKLPGPSSVNALFSHVVFSYRGYRGGSVVKNLPANLGDAGLISGVGDPLEEETAAYSSILAWTIPWTEGPGRL